MIPVGKYILIKQQIPIRCWNKIFLQSANKFGSGTINQMISMNDLKYWFQRSLVIYPDVIPHLYDLISPVENKISYFEKCVFVNDHRKVYLHWFETT